MPRAKKRIQLNLDPEVADRMEALWRQAVTEASRSAKRIPSMSSFWNDELRRLLKV